MAIDGRSKQKPITPLPKHAADIFVLKMNGDTQLAVIGIVYGQAITSIVWRDHGDHGAIW